jgi:predicted ATPase
MALLRRFHDLAEEGSQFVIATHSPIVMSYPGALIYLLTDDGPRQARWEELDHVRITREFLNEPALVLDALFTDGDS